MLAQGSLPLPLTAACPLGAFLGRASGSFAESSQNCMEASPLGNMTHHSHEGSARICRGFKVWTSPARQKAFGSITVQLGLSRLPSEIRKQRFTPGTSQKPRLECFVWAWQKKDPQRPFIQAGVPSSGAHGAGGSPPTTDHLRSCHVPLQVPRVALTPVSPLLPAPHNHPTTPATWKCSQLHWAAASSCPVGSCSWPFGGLAFSWHPFLVR